MKTTPTGYALNRNGKVITSVPVGNILLDEYRGAGFKEGGIYYFFAAKRGNKYIYST